MDEMSKGAGREAIWLNVGLRDLATGRSTYSGFLEDRVMLENLFAGGRSL